MLGTSLFGINGIEIKSGRDNLRFGIHELGKHRDRIADEAATDLDIQVGPLVVQVEQLLHAKPPA